MNVLIYVYAIRDDISFVPDLYDPESENYKRIAASFCAQVKSKRHQVLLEFPIGMNARFLTRVILWCARRISAYTHRQQ